METTTLRALTLEDIDSYGKRLHLNTFFNVLINCLAVIVILKCSTKAMGFYKYYILMTVICAFIMDFHSTFIYGFFIILPTPITCPSGIAKSWGWFWGGHVNYMILHINLSLCGLSLLYGFLYQYISLTSNPKFFQKPKTFIAIFLSMLLYPLPAIVLYGLDVDYETGKAYVKEHFPFAYDIYTPGGCNMNMANTLLYIYLADVFIQVGVVYVTALIFVFKLHKKLAEFKNSLSTNIMNAKKQYFWALVVQLLVPLIFIISPLFVIILFVAWGDGNYLQLSQFAFQFFGFHSCGNSLAVMYIIKPYRQAIIQKLKTILSFITRRTKSVIIQPITPAVSASIH